MKISLTLAAACLLTAPLLEAKDVTFTSSEKPVHLLELYSSEGCSSCPSAEAWVSAWKTNPRLWKEVVPVVFHVDYWDGLGWPDRFAQSQFTERQRHYAAAWRSESVYTPGFVVDGQEWRGWFQRSALPEKPTAAVGALRVDFRETGGNGTAEVSFSPASSVPGNLVAHVAWLGGNLTSDVRRGENSGRLLAHDFVVLHLESAPLHEKSGHPFGSFKQPDHLSEKPLAVAVWVTAGADENPLQATGGWLAAVQ